MGLLSQSPSAAPVSPVDLVQADVLFADLLPQPVWSTRPSLACPEAQLHSASFRTGGEALGGARRSRQGAVACAAVVCDPGHAGRGPMRLCRRGRGCSHPGDLRVVSPRINLTQPAANLIITPTDLTLTHYKTLTLTQPATVEPNPKLHPFSQPQALHNRRSLLAGSASAVGDTAQRVRHGAPAPDASGP